MSLRVASSLLLCTVLASQDPVAVEVIGSADSPSPALAEQIAKGADAFVLFDVAYGIREVTVHLHRAWGWVEGKRAEVMRTLLDTARLRFAEKDDAASRACANVVTVAATLLAAHDERHALEPALRDEVQEVEAATPGSMRFLATATAVDWSETRPIGGYASEVFGSDQFGRLFRATVYLRRYVAAWPEDVRRAWAGGVAAAQSAAGAKELDRVRTAMTVLFGANVDDSALPVPVVAPDLRWLERRAAETQPAGEKLAALFAGVAVPRPVAWSDGVLQLCRSLAEARATDPLFGAMTPQQWQAKWRDAAAFAYVGLREVSPLVTLAGRMQVKDLPTVVVEPLPAVWEALRWIERRQDDFLVVKWPDWGKHSSAWLEPVLEALAAQQRGEDVPAELNKQLLDMLMFNFDASDCLLGVSTCIAGVPAQVRRAVPQLVRVPIVWRGETKKALALRLFVEQQGPDGKWQDTSTLR
jgi:hypothetical protein